MQRWLTIKQDWSDAYLDHWLPSPQMSPDELVRLLRSLSQTCRSLRAYCLPLLWSVVQVEKVSELGRLRETLRASPSIASHIRSFRFAWRLYDNKFEEYAEKEETLLDVAFGNRWRMWEERKDELGCEAVWDNKHAHFEEDTTEVRVTLYFEQEHVRGCWDRLYVAPGKCFPKVLNGVYKDGELVGGETDVADYFMFEPYGSHTVKKGGVGPDDNGEDHLLKSPAEFFACVDEIVSQLSSLQTFGWDTPFTPVPVGAFAALASLTTLTSLHLPLSTEGQICEFSLYSARRCSSL